MSRNNQGGSPEDGHYDLFDGMPARLKPLLWYASASYKVGWIIDLVRRHGLQRGGGMAARRLADDRQQLILKHYGPTHPQARR